jgi:hypothetical protein
VEGVDAQEDGKWGNRKRGSDLPEELQLRQHRLEHSAEADAAALEATAEAVSKAEQENCASPAVVYFSRHSTPAKPGWAAHLRRLAQRLALQRVGRYI